MSHKTIFRSSDDVVTQMVPPDASQIEQGQTRILNYFGRTSGVEFGPEAFVVDLAEEQEVRSHFHDTDQFQVMLGGGGATYKHKAIPQVLVHYADGYTTYGPFSAGSTRMKFLTLRPAPMKFTGFMPDSRDQLPKATRRRRHHIVDLDPWLSKPLPRAGECSLDVVFELDSGAVSASFLGAGADADTSLPPVRDPGGYFLVLEGELIDEADRRWGPWSLGWTTPSGEALPDSLNPSSTLRSGRSGCKAVFLQFPTH